MYVDQVDLYFVAAVLAALCLVLAYSLRQVRGLRREQTGEVQRWRDRAEASESVARRLRAGHAHEVSRAVAAEHQRLQAAQDRAGELAAMLATSRTHEQALAQHVHRLEGQLWNAEHRWQESVRERLWVVPQGEATTHA